MGQTQREKDGCYQLVLILYAFIILPFVYMRSNLLTCKDFFFSEENDFFGTFQFSVFHG